MADKSKTIKGQAYIQPFKLEDGTLLKSLVQEQILLLPNGNNGTNTIVLIEDIWEDLKKSEEESQYKTNGKGYFYWEYKMTDTMDSEHEVTIKLECPKPDYGVFKEPYDPENVTGAYSKFWVDRLKTSTDNYEKSAAIQRKEVTLEGSTYIDQNGEQVVINSTKITNSDLGDLTNLISLF